MFIESTTRVDGMGDGQDISPRGYPEGQSVGASAGPRVGVRVPSHVMSCGGGSHATLDRVRSKISVYSSY